MALLMWGLNQTSSNCWVFRIPPWSGVRWSTFESVHTETVVNLLLVGKAMGLIDLTFPMSEDDKSIWPGNHPFRYFWTKWTKRISWRKKSNRKTTVSEGADNPMDCFIAHVSFCIICLKNWNSKTLRYLNQYSISSPRVIIVIYLTQYNISMRDILLVDKKFT